MKLADTKHFTAKNYTNISIFIISFNLSFVLFNSIDPYMILDKDFVISTKRNFLSTNRQKH